MDYVQNINARLENILSEFDYNNNIGKNFGSKEIETNINHSSNSNIVLIIIGIIFGILIGIFLCYFLFVDINNDNDENF